MKVTQVYLFLIGLFCLTATSLIAQNTTQDVVVLQKSSEATTFEFTETENDLPFSAAFKADVNSKEGLTLLANIQTRKFTIRADSEINRKNILDVLERFGYQLNAENRKSFLTL